MNILAINTAFGACDLCALTGGAARRSIEIMPRGQDAALPGEVDKICRTAGLSLQAMDRIAVVTGPGSFTGLRIGLAYARGLGLALECPVIGVNALEASVPPGETAFVALAAKRRPPDRSWWAGRVNALNETRAEPSECGEGALEALFTGEDRIITDTPDALSAMFLGRAVEAGAPSSEIAARRAAEADPSLYAPSAAYVRPPDAALPKGAR